MSLTEIKDAVETLSPRELAELASFVRERAELRGTGKLMRTLQKVGGCVQFSKKYAKTFKRRGLRNCRDNNSNLRFLRYLL